MTFTDKNNNYYSVIRANDTTPDGAIFKYTTWNARGQMIDAGEIIANTAKEARDRLLND